MDRKNHILTELQFLLGQPRLKSLTDEERAIIIYQDIVLPELELERERWIKLAYTKSINPQ